MVCWSWCFGNSCSWFKSRQLWMDIRISSVHKILSSSSCSRKQRCNLLLVWKKHGSEWRNPHNLCKIYLNMFEIFWHYNANVSSFPALHVKTFCCLESSSVFIEGKPKEPHSDPTGCQLGTVKVLRPFAFALWHPKSSLNFLPTASYILQCGPTAS